LAGNNEDPEEDGHTSFIYQVEGAYTNDEGEEYSFQCLFGECEAIISINPTNPEGFTCTRSGGTESLEPVDMVALECPTEENPALTLLYTIECYEGATLEVVITEA
jgi:hypothetical protein